MSTKTERMSDIPRDRLNTIKHSFERSGATVSVESQPNGFFTIIAVFPDEPEKPENKTTPQPQTEKDKKPDKKTEVKNKEPEVKKENPPIEEHLKTTSLLEKLVSIYKKHNIQYPQLRDVTLAQWLLESGRATSELATQHYNFGGLKWRTEMTPYATSVTYEAHDGIDQYCKFATIESFIDGYWAFINRQPYSGWEKHISSGEDFINFIGPIYCPNQGYVDKVLALLPEAKKLLVDTFVEPNAGTNKTISKKKIMLNAGHAGKAGARGKNAAIKEEVFTDMQSKEIKKLLDNVGVHCDIVNQDVVGGLTNVGKAAQGYDIAISLHFNATDRKEHGTGYLGGQNKQTTIAFANKVCQAIAKAFGYPVLGYIDIVVEVTKEFDKTNCPIAFLLETSFIDDETDIDEFKDEVIVSAKIIADCILQEVL